jgi:hypothetical protein
VDGRGVALRRKDAVTGGDDDSGREALVRRLEELGYLELFHRAGDPAAALRGEPGGRGCLRELMLDEEAPGRARFLAAEVLAAGDAGAVSPADATALAPVYAAALANGWTEWGNAWGIPGEVEGPAAAHLAALGGAAVAPLAALLGDERPVRYSGSQVATLGNAFRFRVKDLALALIRRIRGERVEVHEDPAERDREVGRMQAELAAAEKDNSKGDG